MSAYVGLDMVMLEIRPGSASDREWIYRLRHEVYAHELGQHPPNQAERLSDALDDGNVYIVAAHGDRPVGFISVTPPWRAAIRSTSTSAAPGIRSWAGRTCSRSAS
ncbi:hypothetical protein AB0L53_39690 [Nonomuraea sp. NPDC052129]|uniref:hypothetical protein n=1 Tax=Nonomuraea sp. NPDC052129 TaxID=3154651 RepID=UPI00343ED4A9